jgi:hypothetical protein
LRFRYWLIFAFSNAFFSISPFCCWAPIMKYLFFCLFSIPVFQLQNFIVIFLSVYLYFYLMRYCQQTFNYGSFHSLKVFYNRCSDFFLPTLPSGTCWRHCLLNAFLSAKT